MQRSDKNINKIPTFSYFQDRKIPTFSYFGMKIPTFSYFFDLSYHFQPCTEWKLYYLLIPRLIEGHIPYMEITGLALPVIKEYRKMLSGRVISFL